MKTFQVKNLPVETTVISNFTPTNILEQGVVEVYKKAFSLPPYNEYFSTEEVVAWMNELSSKDGFKLTILHFGKEVIAFAAGFKLKHDLFWIEELATNPDMQGNGFGKEALWTLLMDGMNTGVKYCALKTTVGNRVSRNLYENIGFRMLPTRTISTHQRTDGSFQIDNRVYYGYPESILDSSFMKNSISRVVVYSPNGNNTALVVDQSSVLDSINREELNSMIISKLSELNIEQCGFLRQPHDPEVAQIRMEMFGGEFCGNATRSAVQFLTGGENSTGKIEVSGVSYPLDFAVKDGVVKVEMPIDISAELERTEDGHLVYLDGITHHVTFVDNAFDHANFETYASKIFEKYKLKEQAASGVTIYNPDTGFSDYRVFVKVVNTTFTETACGSGTTAIGMVLYKDQEKRSASVTQPSGENIDVSVANGKMYISGKVAQLFDGEVKLT